MSCARCGGSGAYAVRWTMSQGPQCGVFCRACSAALPKDYPGIEFSFSRVEARCATA